MPHAQAALCDTPLLFFMTSEMTEKFLTIAPTKTLRKMNARTSEGLIQGAD